MSPEDFIKKIQDESNEIEAIIEDSKKEKEENNDSNQNSSSN